MARIPAREILNDIRSGMRDDELTEKYQLTMKGLKRVIDRLVERKAIGYGELYDKSPFYKRVLDRLAARESPRTRVLRPVRVYHGETSQKGFLRDISRNGVRVAGIKANVGEVITLRLPLDEVDASGAIEFMAECRWAKVQGKRKKYVMCGFKVTEISEKARLQFQELITLLRAEGSGSDLLPERVSHEWIPGEGVAAPGGENRTRKFSGKVDGVDILDVVQFLLLIGKTTVLRVVSREGVESRLYLKEGRLVHADLGSLRGETAFFECMNLVSGEFVLDPWCEPTDHTIRELGEFLLVEAARRRDES
jgi:hypothetical protein